MKIFSLKSGENYQMKSYEAQEQIRVGLLKIQKFSITI